MELLLILSLLVYHIQLLLYHSRIYPNKHSHKIYAYIIVIINVCSTTIMQHENQPQFGVLISMATFMIGQKILFQINLLQLLCSGFVYGSILYSFKVLLLSITSLVMGVSIHSVVQSEYFYLVYAVAVLLATVFTRIVQQTVAMDIHVKQLNQSPNQLKYLLLLQFAMLFHLMAVYDGRFITEKPLWFSLLCLKSSILCLILMIVVWNKTLRTSYVQEYERQTSQLQEQLERQVRHYKSYQKYTESYRVFKHDYYHMMRVVKSLINRNETNKAIEIIEHIEQSLRNDVEVHQEYSNNVILDALLQDGANLCDENHISFSAYAHIPANLSLSELDLIRVFSNALNNAIEACCKVEPADHRFIKISSNTNGHWVTIVVENSFNGEIKIENEVLMTTKENASEHGLGIKILQQRLEDNGGILFIEIDYEVKTFRAIMHIPTT